MASEPPAPAAAEQPPVDQQEPSSQPRASAPADGEGQGNTPDVFERRGSADSGDEEGQADDGFVLSRSVQDPSEELPIELISLTDRFINSLSAKVHNSPPTIDKISSLFQVFYARAENHIGTHISTLASRINRDPPPQTASKPRGSALSKLSSKRSQDDFNQGAPGRQMLTAAEVAERRKARKGLEYKRAAMEEAAERRVCELVYDKIWRHKTTLDDVRDEKLRSKTAALLLVGIDLKELGVDIDMASIEEAKQLEANDCLAQARECLEKMNDYKYPLGKLQQLAAAHKAIVDALTKLLPSSSSADEILPALIYSLITCPPEGINIISNFLFMQRFRSSNRIDGESAYCLTNLEAAISFLENVELSSLRAEEAQDGPLKTPETTTPSSERVDPFKPTKETTTSSVTTVSASPEIAKPQPKEPATSKPAQTQLSPAPQQRRLSNLLNPPAKVFEAANDAVRNTADQSLKNIGASLDNSFSFLFGRLKEMQNQLPNSQRDGPVLPKTLAEARRLVAAPPATKDISSDDLASLNSLQSEDSFPVRTSSRAPVATSSGPTPRDRSIDSTRTQGSSKMSIPTSLRDERPSPSANQVQNPLDSMRSFGNSLNPLNHIPGMIKNFGRNTPDAPPIARPLSPAAMDRLRIVSTPSESPAGTASPNPALPKMDPPILRFLETQDARDLRVGDVAVLLEDYKRLASALYKTGAASR